MEHVSDVLHEQRGPAIVFSAGAFSQVQLRALCLPHEHFAWEAQTHSPSERPQQVVALVMMIESELVLRVLDEVNQLEMRSNEGRLQMMREE
ncbi:hypothetical protein MMC06_006648, partial [Schaereria dolodes]|nr:hypothetical protein [Schaereria dolodes]